MVRSMLPLLLLLVERHMGMRMERTAAVAAMDAGIHPEM